MKKLSGIFTNYQNKAVKLSLAAAMLLGIMLSGPASILGYSLSTKVNVLNDKEATVTSLSSLTDVLLIDVSADYCLDPKYENQAGATYQFSLEIEGPSGAITYTETTPAKSIPKVNGLLTYRFKVRANQFSQGLGQYRFKGIYKEDLVLTKNSSVGQKVLLYGTSNNDISGTLRRVELISPANGEEIVEMFPVFQWGKVHPTMKIRYTIWVSENSNPLIAPIYRNTNITDNMLRYPIQAQKLEVGKTYYWKIQAIDENNQPIGGLDGYSETGYFDLSSTLLPKISLVFPVNEEVTAVKPDFSWNNAFSSSYYNVVIARDEEGKELVWVGQTEGTNISIPLKDLVSQNPLEKAYWKVEAFNAQNKIIAVSPFTSFKIGKFAVTTITIEDTIGKSGIKGKVRNLFNETLDKVYIVIAKDLKGIADVTGEEAKKAAELFNGALGSGELINGQDYQITAGAITFLNKPSGDYSADVPPGDYKIAIYKDDYVLYTQDIKIIADKYVNIDAYLIPVFGSLQGKVVDLDTGEPLEGVVVGIRNTVVYQFAKTDAQGFYSIPKAINGKYSVEVIKEYDYKSHFEDGLEILGDRKIKNYKLERIKAGNVAGRVYNKNGGFDIADAKLYVQPLQVDGRISSGKVEGLGYSDAKGLFEITDLKIGLYRIYCETKDYPLIYQNVKIESALTTKIEFNISDIKWEVTGLVFDAERKPLAGVDIYVAERPNFGKVKSGTAGDFKHFLPSGSWTLQYYKAGKNIENKKIEIKDNNIVVSETTMFNTFSYLNLTLTSAVGVIPQAKIKLEPGNIELTTSPVGKIEAYRLPGNTEYTFTVEMPSVLRTQYGVKSFKFFVGEGKNEQLTVEAQPIVKITGTVVDSTGKAVVGALITYVATDTNLKTDASGKFSLDELKAPDGAIYQVVVSHPDYYKAETNISVNANNTITLKSLKEGLSEQAAKDYEKKAKSFIDKAKGWVQLAKDNKDKIKPIFDKIKKVFEEAKTAYEESKDKAIAIYNDLKKLFTEDAKIVEKAKEVLAIFNKGKELVSYVTDKYKTFYAAYEEISADIRGLLKPAEEINQGSKPADVVAIEELRTQIQNDPDLTPAKKQELSQQLDAAAGDVNSAKDIINQYAADAKKQLDDYSGKLKDISGKIDGLLGNYDEIMGKIIDKFAGLEGVLTKAQAWIIEINKIIKKANDKIAVVQKTIDNVVKVYEDVVTRAENITAKLRDFYKKVLEFETKANDALGKFYKFRESISNLSKTLEVNNLGGYQAKVALIQDPSNLGKFTIEGYIKGENPILGKIEINLADDKGQPLSFDLSGILPDKLMEVLKKDYELKGLLPDRFKSLINAEGKIDITSSLPKFLKELVTDENWVRNKINEWVPKLTDYMQDAAKLAVKRLFNKKIETISEESLTAQDRQVLESQGPAAFVAANVEPEFVAATAMPAADIVREETAEQAEKSFMDKLFGGKLKELTKLSPAQMIRKVLPESLAAVVPDDLSKFEPVKAVKALLPASMASAIPDDLDYMAVVKESIDLFKDFSASKLSDYLLKRLPSIILKNPKKLKDEIGFEYAAIEGKLYQIIIGYDQPKDVIYIQALPELNLGASISSIVGLEKVSAQSPVVLYGDGTARLGTILLTFDKNKQFNLGILKVGLETFAVDFDRKKIIMNGQVVLEFLDKTIQFKNAELDGNQGWKLTSLHLIMTPPLRLDYAGWGIVLMEGSYSAAGLHMKGDINLGSPVNSTIKITSLTFSTSGQIKDAELAGFNFNLFGGQVNIAKAGFFDTRETTASGNKIGNVKVQLTDVKFNFPTIGVVGIQKFAMLRDSGGKIKFEISGADVPVNQTFSFAGMKAEIKSVGFGTKDNGSMYVNIMGGIEFKLPAVGVRVGNFQITEDGKFSFSKIGIEIKMAAFDIMGEIGYMDGILEGAGSFSIKGAFGGGVWFKIGGSRFEIDIKISTAIQIGPYVTITAIKGGFTIDKGVFAIRLGCDFGITPLANRLAGTVMLELYFGTDDTYIELTGSAGLDVGMKIPLANAYLHISLRKLYVDGYAEVGYEMFGVTMKGRVNLHISKEYWGVGAFVNINAWNIIKAYGGLVVGYDFPIEYRYVGSMVRSPSKVRGIMFWAGAGFNLNLGIAKLNYLSEFFVSISNPISAGFYSSISGEVKLIPGILEISLAAMVDLGGQIGTNTAYFAGAIMARGCIKIVVDEICASAKIEFSIGNKPSDLEQPKVTTEPNFPSELLVEGKVQADSGSFVEGATIRMVGSNGFDKTLTTDDKGAFSFGKIPAKGVKYTYTVSKTKTATDYRIFKTYTNSFILEQTAWTNIIQIEAVSALPQKVKLIVRDADTREGILGATVVALNQETNLMTTVSTDKDGVAFLNDLIEGTPLQITFSKVGYLGDKKAHRVANNNFANEINMSLSYEGYTFKGKMARIVNTMPGDMSAADRSELLENDSFFVETICKKAQFSIVLENGKPGTVQKSCSSDSVTVDATRLEVGQHQLMITSPGIVPLDPIGIQCSLTGCKLAKDLATVEIRNCDKTQSQCIPVDMLYGKSTVSVVNKVNAPVKNLKLNFADSRGAVFSRNTATNGQIIKYSFAGVKYDVTPDGFAETKSIVVGESGASFTLDTGFSLNVTVKNKETSAAVANATVTLEGLGLSAKTNASGVANFRMEVIPEGAKVQISAKAERFVEGAYVHDKAVKAGDSINATIELNALPAGMPTDFRIYGFKALPTDLVKNSDGTYKFTGYIQLPQNFGSGAKLVTTDIKLNNFPLTSDFKEGVVSIAPGSPYLPSVIDPIIVKYTRGVELNLTLTSIAMSTILTDFKTNLGHYTQGYMGAGSTFKTGITPSGARVTAAEGDNKVVVSTMNVNNLPIYTEGAEFSFDDASFKIVKPNLKRDFIADTKLFLPDIKIMENSSGNVDVSYVKTNVVSKLIGPERSMSYADVDLNDGVRIVAPKLTIGNKQMQFEGCDISFEDIVCDTKNANEEIKMGSITRLKINERKLTLSKAGLKVNNKFTLSVQASLGKVPMPKINKSGEIELNADNSSNDFENVNSEDVSMELDRSEITGWALDKFVSAAADKLILGYDSVNGYYWGAGISIQGLSEAKVKRGRPKTYKSTFEKIKDKLSVGGFSFFVAQTQDGDLMFPDFGLEIIFGHLALDLEGTFITGQNWYFRFKGTLSSAKQLTGSSPAYTLQKAALKSLMEGISIEVEFRAGGAFAFFIDGLPIPEIPIGTTGLAARITGAGLEYSPNTSVTIKIKGNIHVVDLRRKFAKSIATKETKDAIRMDLNVALKIDWSENYAQSGLYITGKAVVDLGSLIGFDKQLEGIDIKANITLQKLEVELSTQLDVKVSGNQIAKLDNAKLAILVDWTTMQAGVSVTANGNLYNGLLSAAVAAEVGLNLTSRANVTRNYLRLPPRTINGQLYMAEVTMYAGEKASVNGEMVHPLTIFGGVWMYAGYDADSGQWGIQGAIAGIAKVQTEVLWVDVNINLEVRAAMAIGYPNLYFEVAVNKYGISNIRMNYNIPTKQFDLKL